MRERVKGLSLVELMVALSIGAVLSLGVSNLFLRSKLNYLQNAQMAGLQENGRYALRYLSHELGMAGYLAGLVQDPLLGSAADGGGCYEYLLNVAVPLEHFDNVTSTRVDSGVYPGSAMDCLAHRTAVAGSDVLVSRRTLDAPAVVKGRVLTTPASDALYLRLVNDGARVSLEPGGGPLDSTVDLWQYSPQLLFLRSYSINRSDGIPTLCRLRLGRGGSGVAPLECLVEGIEDLQLEFGIDDDGDQLADRYLAAPDQEQLRRAVLARIFLLVRSVHPVHGYVNRHSYQLGARRVAAFNDAYYRRLMQTSVMLRNVRAYQS